MKITKQKILITSPSLDLNKNVSGVSSVTSFIIENNDSYNYIHFKLGKVDGEKRGVFWLLKNIWAWLNWIFLITWNKKLIIHFNLALDKFSILRDIPLVFYAQLLKKRMVIHLHGGEYLNFKEPKNWIKKILIFILKRKEPKIVLSTLEKDIIEKKYFANNVISLPNCINLRESLQFNRNFSATAPLMLLFLGRIDSRKGLDDIFQALQILVTKNVKFEFFMAGTGAEKDLYVNKFSKSFANNFKYQGVVKGEKKNELLKNCDLFVLPSLFEGLPIALLEAMSFSLVPIVTDVGSIKSVVINGENGFIVNIQSPNEIAAVIENLYLNRSLLIEMGRKSKQLIEERFNPKQYFEKLNEIYKYA